MPIEFAPLNVPLERRLQTASVVFANFIVLLFPGLIIVLSVALFLSPLAPLYCAYLIWVFLWDRDTSRCGGRRSEWLRRLPVWRYYRDYFPIRLVKTADLEPHNNYIIGYHPHGVIGCGAMCNFATEATDFSASFPGIRPHVLTLRMNFFYPLLRGYLLGLGNCDVSKESIRWILSRPEGGNAAVIVVGGAEEALLAHPGNFTLTLRKRRGFIREALLSGAHLVPCFSFGENDLFKQAHNERGTLLRRVQDMCKRWTGVSPVLFYGRGIFNYNFGLLPFRKPVHTVIGKPIVVERMAKPDDASVSRLHAEYLQALNELFEAHKIQYGVAKETRLIFT